MQKFSGLGVFWLPASPDVILTGQLDYSHESGTRLTIIGSFSGDQLIDPPTEARIFGLIDGKKLTLVGCEPGDSLLSMPGTRRQDYRIEHLFMDAHLAPDMEDKFSTVMVWLDNLGAWVGKSPIVVAQNYHRQEGDTLEFRTVTAKFEPLHPEEMEYRAGTLSLGFSVSYGGDVVDEHHMRSQPYFKLAWPHLVAWQDLWDEVSRLQDLVTICTDHSCGIRKVVFQRDDIPARALNGKAFKHAQEIEYRAALVTPPQ